MADDNKAHVVFETDISEYLRSMAFRTGQSVSYCAHFLLRIIQKGEQTTTLTLKETELPGKPGKETVKFRKITNIKIEL